MSADFSRYYRSYSGRAAAALAARLVVSRGRVRKLSLLNRLRDYLDLKRKPEFLDLHRRLNQHLYEAACAWESYDYGQGYFYQSFDQAGIRGLRDTRGRVEAMKLRQRLAGRRVLEVGSNTGFIAMSLFDIVDRIVGFDINPYLIEISKEVTKSLGCENGEFLSTTFEEYRLDDKFDAVLSFANHSTYDGNTKQSLEEYFRRCRESLADDGLLLFESHPPAFERNGLDQICRLIEQEFRIEERMVQNYGSYLDRGRTFIAARAA